MAETPIEHRHYSRFLGPLARETTYHWRAVLVLSLILFASALALTANPLTTPFTGGATTLFFVAFFGLTILLAFMLRSFKKAFVVIYPAVIGIPLVLLLAKLASHSPSGIENIFATLILTTAAGANYNLIKKYFDERRKPATPLTSIFETFSKLSKAVAGVYILETFAFLGIAAFVPSETGYLGILVASGMVLSLIASVTILPAGILFYEHLMAGKVLTEREAQVYGYVKSYGGHKKHSSPIVAGWLGVAVAEVEDAIESLQAKGYLGSHFFAIDDPLVWFMTFGAYFLGAIFARGGLPSLASIWFDLGIVFLVTCAICLVSPQSLQGLSKGVRGLLGALLAIAAIVISFRTSTLLLEVTLALLALGIVALFFGSTAAWLVGNAAIAIYFSLVFLLGWLQFDLLLTAPKVWAVGVGAAVFLLFLIMEEEAYIEI